MKIIAFTGAGISKSAGIPTFEEVPGLKEKLSLEFMKKHTNEYYEIRRKMTDNMRGKEPTKAHKALAEYSIPIITMNIDCLHTKAGSRCVYEIHGNYYEGNIVLYGMDIHYGEEVLALIIKTAEEAKKNNEEAILLVIGTSMQTGFAVYLTWLAENRGMKVHYINENADEEVPKFLKEHVFLHKEEASQCI